MTENKKRQPYEAPVLTVVSFKVEQGFTSSLTFTALALGWLAGDNDVMEAQRTGYDDAINYDWD